MTAAAPTTAKKEETTMEEDVALPGSSGVVKVEKARMKRRVMPKKKVQKVSFF